MREPALESAAMRAEAPVVLIVEDEEPIAFALQLIVDDAGYAPVIAADGRRALELAREHRPALILTDLMMPRMDGRRFVEALRAYSEAEGAPLPPIIVMTATAPIYAADMGAVAVLPKPFDVTKVESLLHSFLGNAARTAS